MLFVLRSAACIGVVAAVASSGGPSPRPSLADATRGLARDLGRSCAASGACLRAGTALVQAASSPSEAGPPRVVGRAPPAAQARRDRTPGGAPP